jgi:hypothetical protein
VLVVALALLTPVGGQTRRAYWISSAAGNTPQVTQVFTSLVRAIVGASYELREPVTDPAPTPIESTLRQLRSLSPQDLVFMGVDQAVLTEVLRRDDNVMSNLGLEPMNISVGAAPFYLFAQAGTVETFRRQATASRRILYVDKIGALQPADVAALLDPLLRTKAEVVGPLAGGRELARRLLSTNADRADIVGIFDDDPSAFRSDFIAEYEALRPKGNPAQLQALRLMVFPAAEADFRDHPIGIAPNGLTYAMVRYDDLAFSDLAAITPTDTGDFMVALSRSARAGAAPNGLLLLTNLKRRAGIEEYQRVRRMISYAHLAALFRSDLAPVRCVGGSRTAYRLFLLNAYLADRRDLVKSLAVWSDLKLALATAAKDDQSQIQDQIDLVDTMLVRQQNFHVTNKDDWKSLASRLAMDAPLREQFSGQESTLYRQALDTIRLALSETGPSRLRRLQEARGKLVELIRKGVNPACTVGGSEGLFNAREFDPFFYLGLIEAHLAIEATSPR